MKQITDPELTAAWDRIAAACEGELERALLAGEVRIPAKKLLTISRMAPAMRRAQARSYAATGKALELPRYRDVVDGMLDAIRNEHTAVAAEGEDGPAAALARALDGRKQVHTPDGTLTVPPLDTEKVAELLNRLDRALGLVAKIVVDMPRLQGVTPTGVEEAALRERLERISTYAGLVDALLHLPMASASAALKAQKGTYVVLLRLERATRFPRVGPFGAVELPRGHYTYVGSAFGSGGVKARVGHHAVRDKPHPHWHLDYVRRAMEIVEVWCTYDPERRECAWGRLVYEKLGGTVLVPGFGSADCKKFPRPLRCQSHFCHFAKQPSWQTFSEAVRHAVPGHGRIDVVDGGAVLRQSNQL